MSFMVQVCLSLYFGLALCSHYLGNSTYSDVESEVEELQTGVESLLRDSDEEDLYEDSDDSWEEDLVFANITSEDSDSDAEEENTQSNARTATDWSCSVVSPTRELSDRGHGGVQILALPQRDSSGICELFMRDVWELFVDHTNLYFHQKRKDGMIQRLKK
ncbi:hypothetical protein KIN20_025686 [Parelaphostrongylus tenuis]|uniref:Uncharacterized protein n=1 Tax=Parelaphostrongylus tenuis TaxID=148309 RepID=A0AAD5QUL0_PARTN|nr:hypothetical protein KIN20_025686 [Parelaphostrongylus tenuis]